MTRVAQKIRMLAAALDQQGKRELPITVIGTRPYLLRDFKPEKRGGPLRAEGHELNIIRRAPKPEAPDNLDWIEQ